MTDYYKDFDWGLSYKLIRQALKEDIGSGDVTSKYLIPSEKISKARLILKQNSVVAGLKIFESVFKTLNSKIQISIKAKDGKYYEKGKVLALVSGNTRDLLSGERLSLNILQRMSGIANSVHSFKQKLVNNSIKILDTRKTTPNFRIFEKLAVKIGGGVNHRFGLYDMILVKDNHISSNGGILNTLNKLRDIKTKLKIEIEVKDLHEFQIVQKFGKGVIDIVMLDNFSLNEIKKAVILNKEKYRIELSGGISEKNISQYRNISGVDFISSGSLTHSYYSTDISFDFNT
jgi:nicotinate-nucleotide pyrophosphorylase (carboxylating)